MIKPSLRDLKKEATAHALAEAAFELAMEHGLNGFVVDDVAQRAGYSRRTFANYYSCKEEAVAMVAVPFHGVDDGIDIVEQMPENLAPLDVMDRFLKLPLTVEYFRKMSKLVALAKQYPTLVPYILSVHYKLQEIAKDILRHLFHDRYPPEYTHLLTAAITGAILPMFDGSVRVRFPGHPPEEAPGAVTFEAYMNTVFGYLRNGF